MNPIRKHYVKHPKFRTGFYSVGVFLNSFGIWYWLGAAAFISAVALSLFSRLPDELKVPVTAIVSSVLTTIIIPIIINRIQFRNEQKEDIYERILPFYIELLDKILDVLNETEQTSQRQKIVSLSNYIAHEYTALCFKLPAYHMELIYNIKDECNLFFASDESAKASLENIKKYAQAIISEIRKQGNISGKIRYDSFMIEKLEMPELGNMNPPSE